MVEVSDSSFITGYEAFPDDSRLRIQFKASKIIEYSPVAVSIMVGFANADSKGKFYHANIRNAGFDWSEIEQEEDTL